MNSYYLIEEDFDSQYKVYLGEILFDFTERKIMILGESRAVPTTPLRIPVKYRAKQGMADFLNVKLILISDKLKEVLQDSGLVNLYYRSAFLEYEGSCDAYYYITPPQYDCIDYQNSQYEQDERMPGGLRIKGGFYLRREALHQADIFRAKGLSSRKVVCSEQMKELCEEAEIQGVKFTKTELYQDYYFG